MRRIFIGDVQGCAKQLDALLTAVRIRSADRVFFAGDLVNRGPDSLGVLRRACDLEARAVQGNHDLELLRVAARANGKAVRDERFREIFEARDGANLLQWLESQPVILIEDDVVLVHGGLHPLWKDVAAVARELNPRVAKHVRGRVDPKIDFATHIRYCDARGRRPAEDYPPPPAPFQPWDHFYRGRRTVVFGHWARRGLVVEPRIRGLDSGCVYGGALSAWIAEEDRIVQVSGWRSAR